MSGHQEHVFEDYEHASPTERLRQEIAQRAARLVAEDGLDYAGAKRRAARDLLGHGRISSDAMPDNATIEAEVRAYQTLFLSDTQPARLAELRAVALRLMQLLEAFSPYLVGAVANGTAGDHSDIHMQLFCDSAKDVEIFLLNQGLDFEVDEARSGTPRHALGAEEVIRLLWRERGRLPEGVHLNIFTQDRLHSGGERRAERLNAASLGELLKKEQNNG